VTDRIARAQRVIVDLGTGDGRAVLARAAAEPDSLVIGVDAAAAAMAESSRRADRRRMANVLFLADGVEHLVDSPLAGAADLVTVILPWGSLARGILGVDAAALAGIAAVLAPGGRLDVLVSVTPSDHVADLPRLAAAHATPIASAWSSAGLRLTSMTPATDAEVAASGSSWARRLRSGAGAGRPVWRLSGDRHATERDATVAGWHGTSSSSA
jgi:16S rRNA (adenine(1408)-N(1))-methyltransferase